MKELTVEFNLCDSEYMTALRLVAGAVCSTADVDCDLLEDFKLCVTESALILKNSGFERVSAVFSGGESVEVTISGKGGSPKVASDSELSLALIGALVQSCDIHKDKGIIYRVSLKI